MIQGILPLLAEFLGDAAASGTARVGFGEALRSIFTGQPLAQEQPQQVQTQQSSQLQSGRLNPLPGWAPSTGTIQTFHSPTTSQNNPGSGTAGYGKSALAGAVTGFLARGAAVGLIGQPPEAKGFPEALAGTIGSHFDMSASHGRMGGIGDAGVNPVDAGTSPKFDEAKRQLGLFGKVAEIAVLPFKLTVDAFTMLPRVIHGYLQAMAEQSERISENNRGLSMWNGKLAVSFAQLDLTRMQLKIQQANANSGSASEVNRSVAAMEEASAPFNQRLATLQNISGILQARAVQLAMNTDPRQAGSAIASAAPLAGPLAPFVTAFGTMVTLLGPIGRALDDIEKWLTGFDDKKLGLEGDLAGIRAARPALGPAVPPLNPLPPPKGRPGLPPLIPV